MCVYGTRPEAIKVAPVIKELERSTRLEPLVAVTGQHREMLDQVNSLFDIAPEHDLDLMRPGATVAQITALAIHRVTELIEEVRPDAVMVQGDTTSAFAAALAGFYARVPVVHLEAGLRTRDINTPFPEEANRRLTAPISTLHLAPTERARRHLLHEAIDPSEIVITGNTVIDALRRATAVPATIQDERVAEAIAADGPLLLVTTHRRESWGNRMEEAMEAVASLARQRPDLRVVLPMHRNPVVRDVIAPVLDSLPNVVLTEPMSYHEFTTVLAASTLVLTDSGGVQEEAPSLGKPVLVMRDSTERPEAIDAGVVRLVGTELDRIRFEVNHLLDDVDEYESMANAVNPYGDGHAAERAEAAIAELLGVGERLPDFSLRRLAAT
ncbi:UDP-N-acetylglucosamine 2-epimerase (non-hydrolyzing) [Janibacter sp. YIM B02568]|nr:UDP-N-acetylglucosamine 2-epimerase (non-hydrolyzing) [Janibacter endophyticus]